MDPVGGVASVITLIDVILKTFKLIKSLTHAYKNAPAEIQSLRRRLDELSMHVSFLRKLQKTACADENFLDLDPTDLDHLKQSLSSTQAIFAEILSFLTKKTTKSGRSAHFRWAVSDASKVRALESKLQRHSGDLQITLLFLTNQYSSVFLNKVNKINETLKALSLEVRLKRQSPFLFGVVPKNIIPEESGILIAARRGEASVVWNLLNEGKASVNDVSPDNLSPLAMAIIGGSVGVLSVLVSRGADTTKSFGNFQTGPLDLALAHRQYTVARWLLEHRADVHHVGTRGWTPLFSLLGTRDYQNAPFEEYLELFSATSFDGFNSQDAQGWSIMHRAAAHGTPEQIKSLVRRNVSLNLRTANLMRDPIFCAVKFGKLETFDELIKHQPSSLMAVDARNWTLLHVAVDAGRSDMIWHLIQLGADPRAQSYPASDSFIPSNLEGLALTPGDIAKVRGRIVFTAYLDALAYKGFEFRVLKEEEEDTWDIFWPALEDLGSEIPFLTQG